MRIDLGCGQITWRGLDEEQALSDIAGAGYVGAPWGGGGERTAAEIAELHGRYGLKAAPGYLGGDFWDAARHDEFVATAHRYAEISAALGLSELYLAAAGFGEQTRAGRQRWQAAGHVVPEDALPDAEFDQLARTVDAMGAATLEHGVRCCFHSHVGTVVESEDEVERLLAATDPELTFLGPDTGHLAWAGIDPVAFTKRHTPRIRTMHLKDMHAGVREQGVAEEWDYPTFEAHGIWAEIGEGVVDFPAILRLLDGVGFDGWLIVETDVTQKDSPAESARVSRENLRAIGV